MSGVVCLINDDDFVGSRRCQRYRRSKILCLIPNGIKKSPFVRTVDNNVITSKLLT